MIEVSNLLLADWDSPQESPWCVSYEAKTECGTFPEVELVSLDGRGRLSPQGSMAGRTFSGLDFFREHGMSERSVVTEVCEKLAEKLQSHDFRVSVNDIALAKSLHWRKLIGPAYLKAEMTGHGENRSTLLTALSGVPGGADDIRTGGSSYYQAKTPAGRLTITEAGRIKPVLLDNLTGGRQGCSHIYVFPNPDVMEKCSFRDAGYYGVFRSPELFSVNGETGERESLASLRGNCHVFCDNGTFLLVMKRQGLPPGRPRGSFDRYIRKEGSGMKRKKETEQDK